MRLHLNLIHTDKSVINWLQMHLKTYILHWLLAKTINHSITSLIHTLSEPDQTKTWNLIKRSWWISSNSSSTVRMNCITLLCLNWNFLKPFGPTSSKSWWIGTENSGLTNGKTLQTSYFFGTHLWWPARLLSTVSEQRFYWKFNSWANVKLKLAFVSRTYFINLSEHHVIQIFNRVVLQRAGAVCACPLKGGGLL